MWGRTFFMYRNNPSFNFYRGWDEYSWVKLVNVPLKRFRCLGRQRASVANNKIDNDDDDDDDGSNK